MAESADTLEQIRNECLENKKLIVDEEFSQLVFGKGNSQAKIFFIGEAPGAKEAEQGVPFVGAAGRELDKSLHQIGLSLDDCYVANILKYRPPQNRDPSFDEIVLHTPYLVRQIECIKPTVILTLGRFATQFVLSGFCAEKEQMSKIAQISSIHGEKHNIKINGQEYVVIPLYHPAAMLYNPKLRKIVENDFQKVKTYLD